MNYGKDIKNQSYLPALSGGGLLYLDLKRSLSFEITLPRIQMIRNNPRRMQKIVGSKILSRKLVLVVTGL